MPKLLQLELDRTAKTPLAEQIRNGISSAIESGVLASGARLPSWQDLAAQLGVARGTVRSAYEKLYTAQLIVASRATGTHVAARPSITARLELLIHLVERAAIGQPHASPPPSPPPRRFGMSRAGRSSGRSDRAGRPAGSVRPIAKPPARHAAERARLPAI